MIDLVSGSESVAGYSIRAWAGTATDEGVGLICLAEVSNDRGLVCRFEVLLPAAAQLRLPAWAGPDPEVARRLLQEAQERARYAIETKTLPDLHGRRLEIK
jgi:hypothetical protein